MTQTFGGWLNGAIAWVEKEIPTLAPSVEADVVAAKAHFQPLVDQVTKQVEADAAHLAAVIQTDGLKAIGAAAAAFQGGSVDDAAKAALVALQAMGKDVTNLSADSLRRAVAAATAGLSPVPVGAQA